MIERLRGRTGTEGLSNIEGRVMNGEALELPDDTFDVSALHRLSCPSSGSRPGCQPSLVIEVAVPVPVPVLRFGLVGAPRLLDVREGSLTQRAQKGIKGVSERAGA